MTLPQLRGMYNGDQARKQTLVEHGFRLPSAKDNRPLNFDEFLEAVGQVAVHDGHARARSSGRCRRSRCSR